jgi:hypothetical protein
MKRSGSSAMGMAWTSEDGTKIEQVMLISNLVVTIELHNKVIRLGGQGTTRGGHANLEVDRRQEKGGLHVGTIGRNGICKMSARSPIVPLLP